MNDPNKPGWATTEFWASIFALVVTALVSLHAIPAADSATVMGYLNAIAASVIGLGGSIILIYRYIHGRIEAKAQAAHVAERREADARLTARLDAKAAAPNLTVVTGK